ncbi:AzlD domain-containing protein [uncultured Acinetobacter sp.]|uniref:AzlD domain-containing protein n=1 Tax=uncultured Acinetobacter sp. TaxID=165433 RepID=UPI0025DC9ED0|nr:AzlD domain-containing protein [uncultured Acinetobacter sp.]
MTWILLLSLAFIVFINRYFFLEPKIAFKLPVFVENMLQYSAPCLLTAICAPIVFFHGEELRTLPLDAYFLTAILCVVFALISKKILLNLSLSLLCFYTLNYFLHG